MSKNGVTLVLVIDDSEAVRAIARDMLHLLDVEVLTASGGAEGVTAFQQHAIDLVLLDMNMPEMDGAATYKALLAIDPDVKAIICSSDSKSKVGVRLGDDVVMPKYLHKPFDTAVFLDAVEAILAN